VTTEAQPPSPEIPASAKGATTSLSALLARFEQAPPVHRLTISGSTVVTVVAVAVRVRPGEVLPAMLVLCAGLSLAGACDLLWMLLPKRIVYPTWLLGCAGLLAAAANLGAWSAFRNAAIGAAAFFTVLLLFHLASGGSALAFGDVRLGLPVGTTLGWFGLHTVLTGVLLSAVMAAASGAVVFLRARRRDALVPFGAFLAFGAVVSVLLQ
jgi:leader peptidase (prepilin peptidase)/N-methyltransferase